MNVCRVCKTAPGNLGGRFLFCVRCVETIQAGLHCPDCIADIVVLVEEGCPWLHVDVHHADSCPAWRAIRDAS